MIPISGLKFAHELANAQEPHTLIELNPLFSSALRSEGYEHPHAQFGAWSGGRPDYYRRESTTYRWKAQAARWEDDRRLVNHQFGSTTLSARRWQEG